MEIIVTKLDTKCDTGYKPVAMVECNTEDEVKNVTRGYKRHISAEGHVSYIRKNSRYMYAVKIVGAEPEATEPETEPETTVPEDDISEFPAKQMDMRAEYKAILHKLRLSYIVNIQLYDSAVDRDVDRMNIWLTEYEHLNLFP